MVKSEPSPGGATSFSGSSVRHESVATPGESVGESMYQSASSPDEPTVHSTSGDIVVDAELLPFEQPGVDTAPVDSGTDRGRASDSDDVLSVSDAYILCSTNNS